MPMLKKTRFGSGLRDTLKESVSPAILTTGAVILTALCPKFRFGSLRSREARRATMLFLDQTRLPKARSDSRLGWIFSEIS